jgi:type III pantothenate kinase
MNLLVDLGNARIKWARSAPGVWETGAALLAEGELGRLLDRFWVQTLAPEKVVAANVSGSGRLQQLERWVYAHWARHVQAIIPQRELLGIKNHYNDPRSLGADRWAALIAARHLMPGPVCIVDCGTAVTIDALSESGDFLGGVIFPGLRLLRTSLLESTHGIRQVSGDDASCLGRSTGEAVSAGTLFGLIGAIERILEDIRPHLGPGMKVLTTGADGPLVRSRMRVTATDTPDLVLRGLALIAEQG